MSERDQKLAAFDKLEETYPTTKAGSSERYAAETFTVGFLRWCGYRWLAEVLESQLLNARSPAQSEYALKTILAAAKTLTQRTPEGDAENG